MIVVGGWPGRNVVGLNGRFGVRPAAFAIGGDFDNPFLNDTDPGDETTEFVAVVQSLPASGTVTFEDDGGFSHTGAADGSYSTAFTLYTWAQGGPLTTHTPDEIITTQFGAVSAAGVTLTASASLIAGAASGASGATAAGATLTASAALLAGAAAGQVNAAAAGVTLTAASSLVVGSASGEGAGVAAGVVVAAAASLLAGSASGQQAAEAAGVTLVASSSLLRGSATGAAPGVCDPADVWAHVLSNGKTAEQNLVENNAMLAIVTAILRNKRITDPVAGTQTIFADDGISVLLQGGLFEDAAGTQPYRGQGADRAERLT
jgi:hypothetical protein